VIKAYIKSLKYAMFPKSGKIYNVAVYGKKDAPVPHFSKIFPTKF